ncbi:IS3 family transposase, partial [Klebsiella pneumoniae]
FIVGGPVGDFELLLCHGTVCVVGKMRDLILQLSKSSIYSTKPLFARNVVGWSMKPTLSRELALHALMMAVWRRKPDGEVIVHSDQGSQYGSDDWQHFCRANNLAPSMSRRGNCWDNAVAESFFSSLKKERIRKRIYKTRDMARADIFDYIEVFYNRNRRHSHLGGVSPKAFEQASS